ncbi:cytochrome P450, partial [Favolaschia claudopus]
METLDPIPPSLLPLIAALIWCCWILRARKSRTHLPPGPKGLPWIGNAFQMPTESPWLTYNAWAKAHGPIIQVSVFGQSIIILNSAQVVRDLLDRRSANYSDRPALYFGGEVVGYKYALPLRAYGDFFRQQRKLSTGIMGSKSTVQWQSLEEKNLKIFLLKLLKKPESFREEIHLTIASITFAVTHGYTVQKENDPLIPIGKKANADFVQCIISGAYLCDSLPILQYIPTWMMGAKFRREAKEFRHSAELLRDVPYDFVKAEVARGTAKASFTASLIQREQNLTAEDDFLYKWTSASIFGAATDTTVAALESFFFAMSLYPEVQAKAREELDRVVGMERLPSFEDRSNLLYVNALLSEVHRWNPVLPLAIAHRALEDDTYMGFLIPKGAIMVPNSWAILHNESIYPDPMTFNPERFLNNTDAQPEINPDPRKFAFGYGRRVCPGKDLADDILFISIAMILTAFDIRGPKGTGDAEIRYTSSLLSRPPRFECEIRPRSDIVEAL